MREGIRTSLFAVACVMAVSGVAYAAASVRSVGGTGTYTSAASAASSTTAATQSSGTAARGGSLRATGTYVRPTTTTGTNASTANGTTSRSATSSRLSIGKYVGAPISISQQGGGSGGVSDERIETIERLIQQLETEKQVVLRDTDYITVTNDEVKLNVERLTEELSSIITPGEDGREIELDADNNDGIKWRYRARANERPGEWQLLVSWDAIKSQMNLGDINSLIERAVTAQMETFRTEFQGKLNDKVDKAQGTENAGKVLTVDAEGHVTPGNVVYSQTEVDQFITNIGDDLDTKVDKAQGRENAGKVLLVGADGAVTTGDVEIPDVSGKVDKLQGREFAGTVLTVTDEGYVKPSRERLGKLAYKDQVGEREIEDASITRAKAAEDIAGVLDWIDWWKLNAPEGENAVLSIDSEGNKQWFVVVDE
ncbi:MAG: hypothetical protein J5742_00715 [Alphaproteobacteria bacterium]|nr:hypothetical protein [Alphaproteobacteria bacterium]